MALWAAEGVFTSPTSTATTNTITGLPGTPKVIVFYTAGYPTASATFTNHAAQGVGWATSTSALFGIGANSSDNVSTTSAGGAYNSDHCIVPGGYQLRGKVTSFTADGFVVSWTIVQATGRLVHYLALGGADLQAECYEVTLPTTATTQSVTAGTFAPDAILAICARMTAAGTQIGASISVGAASFVYGTSVSQWGETWIAASGQTMTANVDAMRQQRTDCIIPLLTSAGAQDGLVSVTSTAVANGFQISTTADAPAAAYKMAVLALKGGQYRADSFTKTASVASDSVTAPGFLPVGALFLGANIGTVTLNTIVAGAIFSLGGSAGTNHGAAYAGQQDAVLPTTADSRAESAAALITANPGATPTLTHLGTPTFASTGFTMAWSATEPSAPVTGYLVIGDVAGGGAKALPPPFRPNRTWTARRFL